jgi:hypothetical protein
MISIITNNQTNNNIFKLWKKHYDEMKIQYNIYNNIQDVKKNSIILTEYDFLFKYNRHDNNIILNNKIKEEDLTNPCVIGKVFSVRIRGKKEFTTFEKMDFISYKNYEHRNYTKNGIIINFNKKIIDEKDISNDLVCLSLRYSDIEFNNEYYETNIFYDKKYNSAIHTTARDEDNIINEWIVHHILLGFEHIYIYDDNSIIPISDTVKILPDWIQKKLTIYRLTFDNFVDDEIINTEYMDFYKTKNFDNKQIFIISYFIFKHRHLINWCYFCDVDEFIYLKDHENINDFLNNYKNVTNLLIPWILYGTSYIVENTYKEHLIMDYNRYHRITYCDDFYAGKSITNLNEEFDIFNYHIITKNNLYYIYCKTEIFNLPIHINHYQKIDVKTYLKRKLRNDIGNSNMNKREATHLFKMLVEDNITNLHSNKMDKYIVKIAKILNKIIINYNLDLNKDYNLCSNILYSNNQFISINSKITYDLLKDLLNDENLRYAYWNELLPIDFDVKIYKELYPHLRYLNDIDIKLHHLNTGIKNNLPYKLDTLKLPIDFDVKMYKELNPDLINLNDVQSKLHYIEYGINEGRKYNYDISKLPIDFDVHMYREFNYDIRNYNDSQLISHYIHHGIFEKRQYKDIHFNAKYFSDKYNLLNDDDLYLKYISDIRQLKNSYFSDDVNKHSVNSEYKYIFLVNHDYSLFGSNHYMYLLFNILSKKFVNTNIKPLLCEVEYNPQLLPKYSICQNDVVEYKNDPTLLYMLYEHFNPKLVYLNSCNFAIFNVYKYIPKDITIIHSHEIFEHYLLAKTNVPSFVVSHRIAQEYNTYYKNDNNYIMPSVQPPFLNNIEEILTLSNENIYVISNGFGIIDMNKITIGMCGQITNRKNYQLFIEVSKHYPQYNFLWIGDDNNVFTQYNNIYYITHTNNPYKYYKQILDYFILFSHQDPCPYVILENIVLETKIITFAKNIYTEHKSDLIKDFYFEYPNEINLNNCIDAINIFVNKSVKSVKKTKITSNKGREYIDKYFSFPHQIYQKIENILNN